MCLGPAGFLTTDQSFLQLSSSWGNVATWLSPTTPLPTKHRPHRARGIRLFLQRARRRLAWLLWVTLPLPQSLDTALVAGKQPQATRKQTPWLCSNKTLFTKTGSGLGFSSPDQRERFGERTWTLALALALTLLPALSQTWTLASLCPSACADDEETPATGVPSLLDGGRDPLR